MMTLPTSGPISFSQINTELSRPATTTVSLNEAAVRGLAGVVSGPIGLNNLLGKAAWVPSLFPPTDSSFGTVTSKNFLIECYDYPAGATFVWSFGDDRLGGWTVLSGQGTDTVTVRVTGSPESDFYATVICTVTKDGVSKQASGLFEYSSYSV